MIQKEREDVMDSRGSRGLYSLRDIPLNPDCTGRGVSPLMSLELIVHTQKCQVCPYLTGANFLTWLLFPWTCGLRVSAASQNSSECRMWNQCSKEHPYLRILDLSWTHSFRGYKQCMEMACCWSLLLEGERHFQLTRKCQQGIRYRLAPLNTTNHHFGVKLIIITHIFCQNCENEQHIKTTIAYNTITQNWPG